MDEMEMAMDVVEEGITATDNSANGTEKATACMCVECEDVPAAMKCLQCTDDFCALCFQWMHKSGARRTHVAEKFPGFAGESSTVIVEGTTEHFARLHQQQIEEKGAEVKAAADEDVEVDEFELNEHAAAVLHFPTIEKLAARCQCIPLRLNEEERVLLRLLEGALEVSEYTDKVDVSNDMYGWRTGYSYSSYSSGSGSTVSKKDQVMKRELNDMFSIISGLIVANNFRSGSKLTKDSTFEDNAQVFSRIFELGRRFKIMNPSQMRNTYGKLMHLLQDAVQPGLLTFNCVTPIKTVYRLLEAKDALDLLQDERLLIATCVVKQIGVSRKEIEATVAAKRAAREALCVEYTKGEMTREDVELCLDSIGDNNNYLTANREPVDRMIELLKTFPRKCDGENDPLSLAIRAGRGGSCLTHDHSRQFQFVIQSLLLWREIQHQMPYLWMLADQDLLNPNSRYRLCNTGQGLNRVQPAPNISRAMSSILGRVQSKLGGWVGLSVVHLGDRDVPNALVFIDKYTQVPRILGPIARTVDNLGAMADDPHIKKLVESRFGGVEGAKRIILRDFFRHGFDGSGSDGGSCVDGRLTSAWNWCSRVDKKVYYSLFLLACFEGFDGSWKDQS